MWNELIYLRYNRQVKIDKSSLINKIDNLDNKQRKEYLLSEIVFQKKKDEDLNILKKKIKESILEIGFNNTANIFSLSESSKMGGNIGWVSENNLSNIILNKIKNINENEMTDIILIGNNYLIIKVNKIRFKEININKEEELEKMIKFETNNQLNKLSRIFFSKSIMNYSINEN
jgi:peptidyl-prolyl cis-trans isomerase SurA